jgi:hypothetical protein
MSAYNDPEQWGMINVSGPLVDEYADFLLSYE